jgi:prepilin-type N-terminal cleavage/methylation domain-containing protein
MGPPESVVVGVVLNRILRPARESAGSVFVQRLKIPAAEGVVSHERRLRGGGFSLIELLVAMAILAVLIGLLLPAVQKVRETAARIKCGNSLRQVAMAAHQAHDTTKSIPPGIGYWPGNTAYGTFHFHLLPYLEQDALYRSSYYAGFHFVGNNGVFERPVKTFLCPSDPSVPGSSQANDLMGNVWGVTSYAANGQVVCRVTPNGQLLNPAEYSKLLASFPDGSSNTVLLTEKYAQCFDNSYPAGGTFWAYYFTSANLQPYHPGYAISWNAYSVGPASKFLVRPQPYNGGCDPTLASSPHAGGIQIALSDGSVRFLSAHVSQYTWWYLTTPSGGEAIPADAY